MEALESAALVREIHVYGRAQELGARDHDRTQHRGLGTQLLHRAERIAADAGYSRMAIIASVGIVAVDATFLVHRRVMLIRGKLLCLVAVIAENSLLGFNSQNSSFRFNQRFYRLKPNNGDIKTHILVGLSHFNHRHKPSS